MSDVQTAGRAASGPAGRGGAARALALAAAVWFATALVGQWAFGAYIVAFYGPSTLSGNFQAWSRNHFLLKGYVAGDTTGNVMFAAHVLAAGYVALGGVLQLFPQIRKRAPAVHRWNGRLFVLTAMGVALSGLYMVWVRHATTGLIGSAAISLNAALILVCAAMAWRLALARRFADHRPWALRLWLVANGQWFFRIAIFGWLLLNGGRPVGLGENLDGPVAVFWSFGCYLVPLGVLQLYLSAQGKAAPVARLAVAGLTIALTLLMAVGIFGLAMLNLTTLSKT